MPPFELTREAEADLKDIARYTIEQWGETQARSYLEKIGRCFKTIATHRVASRNFSEKLPDARVVRCEHHYVFYIYPKEDKPIILAVLHERMDMLTRLKDRLG